MVKNYLEPSDADEAIALLSREENARLLAGGTYLLTSRFAGLPMTAISVSSFLPKAIESGGDRIILGAGATFQEALDSAILPEALRRAALGMADRNIRNRATIGGNIGADTSCSSLIPFFLAAEASYRRYSAPPIRAEEWHALPTIAEKGIVEAVEFAVPASRRFAYGKYSRTSCDIAVLTCAVSADFEAGLPRRLRIAMGGLSPRSREFPELEAFFEGKKIPSKAEIEAAAAPFFSPVTDARGSAAFKRLRAAVLLADLMSSLEERP